MKSTKYQLLKHDFDFACKQLREHRLIIEDLRKENEELKRQLSYKRPQISQEPLETAPIDWEEDVACKACNGKAFFFNVAKGYEEQCVRCDGTGKEYSTPIPYSEETKEMKYYCVEQSCFGKVSEKGTFCDDCITYMKG